MVDPDTVDRVVATGFALVIAVLLFSSLFGAAFGLLAPATSTLEVETIGGSGSYPAGAQGITVRQSLGDALAFDGSADSEFTTDGAVDVGDQSELCTWVRVQNTGANATIVTAGGQWALRYAGNQSTATWVASFYNESDRVLYDVEAAATTPGSWTHLCARANGSLTLAVNATDVASVPMDGSHTAAAATAEYGTLNGSVDETRVYDGTLSATQRTQLYNHPTRPLDGGAAARVMYDAVASSPSTLPVYFTGESGDVRHAQLVAGFAGEPVVAGEDYRLSDGTITLLDGGVLEGAPVVWLTAEFPTGPFAGTLQLAAEVVGAGIVLVAVGILAFGGFAAKEVLDGEL